MSYIFQDKHLGFGILSNKRNIILKNICVFLLMYFLYCIKLEIKLVFQKFCTKKMKEKRATKAVMQVGLELTLF